MHGTVSTHAFANVFWLRLTHANPVTVNDLETILNGIIDSFATQFMAQTTSNVIYNELKATFIKAAGESLEYTHTETKTGTDANVLNDSSACVVINWATGEYYRGGHPRTYLPGPQANHITNASNLDAAQQANRAAAAQAWLNAVNALTSTNVTQVEMGTVRFESALAWLSPPRFVAYQSASCRAVLGSQRRRLIG